MGIGLTETFGNALPIVIIPSTGFTPLEQSVQHDLLRSGDKQDEGRLAHLKI